MNTDRSQGEELSVNVVADIGNRLRRLAFEERVSESSIVEIALVELFARLDDDEIRRFLRERGATLRRPRPGKA